MVSGALFYGDEKWFEGQRGIWKSPKDTSFPINSREAELSPQPSLHRICRSGVLSPLWQFLSPVLRFARTSF